MASTASEVTLTVKLFATLRRHTPEGADPRGFSVALPAGATLGDLAARLQFPETAWKRAFRNNARCVTTDLLRDGDVVAFFPPIAGG